ncbi:hypothetical protein [Acinetobacter faecalis]|uniref:Uncharacterized protein n=1 Tax=Acinetobacter faecalis TaxID=2665161 RepID=A0ABU5GHK5_9GAMM|nr:hypothetical protein [Acinetobacter faecalis]MDY6549872.1 hypothetical protein [Acinetobacter faecalis]
METYLIELLEKIVLTKEDCPPITFEKGTILKVLMQTPSALLVSSDSNFNFTIHTSEENKVWRNFKE